MKADESVKRVEGAMGSETGKTKAGMAKAKIRKKLKGLGLTGFQISVLLEVLKIPRGETRTYKEIAKAIRHPKAYRAVGNALKRNPLPIVIPCHRVIRSDGSIGGYSAGGSKRKAELLEKERKLAMKL